MSCESGYKARFAVKGGSAPRDMSSGSVFWPCVSDGIKKNGTILRPAGITGSRSQRQELIRDGAYAPGGPVVLEPSFAFWDEWLPRILGAAENSDEFLVADTLPEFDWMSDRVGRVVRYNDCKVNRMELRFAPGLLQCTLDIMGLTAVETGNTFPTVVHGVTDSYAPQAFHHAVITIEGEARSVREGTLIIDNQLDPRPSAGSQGWECLREGERIVTLQTTMPGTADNWDECYAVAAEDAANATIAITRGGLVTTFTLYNLTAPEDTPIVNGKDELVMGLQYQAGADASPGYEVKATNVSS